SFKKRAIAVSTLRVIANHEMLSLRPNEQFSDSSAATPILKLVAPGLLTFDLAGNLIPDVAQSWSHSEDLKNYEFEIPDNLVFHDRSPALVQDIADSLKRSLDPRFGSLHVKDLALISNIEAV